MRRRCAVDNRLLLTRRGGDLSKKEEESRALDEYIEQLVASVDTSEIDDVEEEDEDEEALLQQDEEAAEVETEETDAEEDEDVVPDSPELDQKEEESRVVPLDSSQDKEEAIAEDVPGGTPYESKKQRRGKKRKKAPAGVPDSSVDQEKAETPTSTSEEAPAEQQQEEEFQSLEPSSPPRRPNALYRFLLGQGRVGHVIVMTLVLIVEWIQTFVPILQKVLGGLFLKIFGASATPYSVVDDGISEGSGVQSKVNVQYGAFVSTDGSTVRGKQRKKLTKQADLKAAEQLRRVGSVRQAKYRHVSVNFMKRHGLGPYGATDALVAVDDNVRSVRESTTQKGEEESDVDWVVEAFLPDEEKERKGLEASVTPSVSLGVGSDGPSVGVGLEIEFGGSKKRKKKKSRKSVLEIVTEEDLTPSKKKKSSGPRASDRDGGGGLVGRIRSAVGSNLPSSLLGAYPGDAVPPEEAASADGVIALAKKYGYGDWSDDESDGGSNLIVTKRRRKKKVVPKKRRSGSSRSRKKHKSRRSMEGGGSSLSLGFEMSLGESSSRTTPTQKKTRRRRSSSSKKITLDNSSTKNTSSRSTSILESLIKTKDSEQRKDIAKAETLFRLPTERTKEVRAKLEEEKNQESN